MSLIQKVFDGIFSSKPTPPPAASRPPDLLAIDGELIDLNTLSPAQLAALETLLLSRRQQQQEQLLRYLHELAAERQRLLASTNPEEWLLTLKLLFGEALGRRVAAQDISPGMQLQHLVLSMGPPSYIQPSETGVTLRYGDDLTGSYFDLEGNVITNVVKRSGQAMLPALGAG